MSTHDPLRLFFAVELNAELRQALAQIIDELKQKPWAHRVKWAHPDNLHVPLRFLGTISREKVPELTKHAQSIIEKINPFFLQLNNVRPFPSPIAPRAIAVDIYSTAELFELASALGEVTLSLDSTHETKPYLPHLTLGWITNQHSISLREEPEEPKLNHNSMRVDKIVLFNSEKTEYSQSYKPLQYISLQKAQVNNKIEA